jgi:hypothetical protein
MVHATPTPGSPTCLTLASSMVSRSLMSLSRVQFMHSEREGEDKVRVEHEPGERVAWAPGYFLDSQAGKSPMIFAWKAPIHPSGPYPQGCGFPCNLPEPLSLLSEQPPSTLCQALSQHC